MSLRVDVLLGSSKTRLIEAKTFAEKVKSVHFRVVRGTTIVPAPIIPVLVIGGGQNGLSLALAVGAMLASSNIAENPPVTVVEAGDIGNFVKSWHDWTVPRSTSDTFVSAELTWCKKQAFNQSEDPFITCSLSEYLWYLSKITRDGEANGHIRFFAHSV